MEKNEFWLKIKEKFEENLPEQSFKTVIEPLEFNSFNERFMVLEAPSEFIKEQFENQLEGQFRSFAFEISSDLVEPVLVVLSKPNNKDNKEVSNNSKENEDNKQVSSELNPNYTFDSYVVGDANSSVTAAARLVSEEPGKQYNPLLIFGGVGLGKTHLMQAIGNKTFENNKNFKIKYITTEEFINDFTNSLRSGEEALPKFKNEYRNVDLLLVDDIQLLEEKFRIQEEFFNTFNALTKTGAQIVLTSDRLPKNMPGLEERLVSRFNSGLSMDIQKPDLPTRVAILRSKSEQERLNVPDEVIDLIAKQIDTNVRDLEGAFNNIKIQTKFSSSPITIEKAQKILDSIGVKTKKEITIKKIQEVVADHFLITREELNGPKRDKNLVFPRHIAIYLSRQLTETSLPKIGKEFGKDHSTILYSTNKINSILDGGQDDLQETIDILTDKIKN